MDTVLLAMAVALGAACLGALALLVTQVARTYGRLEVVARTLGVVSAQTERQVRLEKRLVDLLEDLRAGRGEEGDLARAFSEAEEQKVAFFKLSRQTDEQSIELAHGVRRTATALYQEIIERFPDSREAQIARETLADLGREGAE